MELEVTKWGLLSRCPQVISSYILKKKGLLNFPQERVEEDLKDPYLFPITRKDLIVSSLSPIEIKMVHFTQSETLYNGLIQAYHYLGIVR